MKRMPTAEEYEMLLAEYLLMFPAEQMVRPTIAAERDWYLGLDSRHPELSVEGLFRNIRETYERKTGRYL